MTVFCEYNLLCTDVNNNKEISEGKKLLKFLLFWVISNLLLPAAVQYASSLQYIPDLSYTKKFMAWNRPANSIISHFGTWYLVPPYVHPTCWDLISSSKITFFPPCFFFKRWEILVQWLLAFFLPGSVCCNGIIIHLIRQSRANHPLRSPVCGSLRVPK